MGLHLWRIRPLSEKLSGISNLCFPRIFFPLSLRTEEAYDMVSSAGYLKWGLTWGGGLMLLFVSQCCVPCWSSIVRSKKSKHCAMVIEYDKAPQLLLAIPSQPSRYNLPQHPHLEHLSPSWGQRTMDQEGRRHSRRWYRCARRLQC